MMLLALARPVVAADAARDRIIYQGGGPALGALYLADADGQHERLLLPPISLNYNPSFSPDGQWIVFTSEREGSADIYRVHPDGSGVERMTDSPSFDDQGTLSPDGRTLAFVSTREGGTANIWLRRLTGNRYVNLTRNSHGNFRPSWSPDGRWIAFSSDRDAPHARWGPDVPPPKGSGCCGWELMQSTALYIVHPDGSGLRRLTPVDQIAGSPKWSADNRRIVYYLDSRTPSARRGPGGAQIAAIDITTGQVTMQTRGEDQHFSPQYLDASTIGYVTRHNGQAMLADSTGRQGPPGDVGIPSWAPDAKTVVYGKFIWNSGPPPNPIARVPRSDPTFDLYRADYLLSYSPDGRSVLFAGSFQGDSTLWVMDAAGPNHRTLFDTKDKKLGIVSPTWSPDGKSIAFAVGRYGLRNPNITTQVALIGADGSGMHVVTQGSDNDGYPGFSPDGQHLVYRVFGKENGLRILSVKDGSVTRLTNNWDNFPSWSPAGDRIMFTGFSTGDFEIYTIRPDGSGLQQLTHDHGNDAHSVWSPDGKWIALTTSRTGWKDESTIAGSGQAYGEVDVMREDGSHRRPLTDDQWEEAADVWLPAKRPH